MGLFKKITKIASVTVDYATRNINAQRNQLIKKHTHKRKNQMEKIIESIKDIISQLRMLVSMWDEEIEDTNNAISQNNNDGVLSKLRFIECLASVLGDESWLRERILSNDLDVLPLIELSEGWHTIAKYTDETFYKTDAEKRCMRQHLMFDANCLAHRIHMLLDDIENKDIYQVSQSAINYINDFQKSLG